MREWKRLRNEWLPAGFAPVVMGGAKEASLALEVFDLNSESVAQLLELAGAHSAARVFKEREQSLGVGFDSLEKGNWPSQVAPQAFSVHCEILSGKPHAKVFIAKLPTTKSHEIPVLLKCGGWNDCPLAQEHSAVMKYWHEKYGAEIFSVTGEIIECSVARPPATREEATKLAYEQFLYCPDVVTQGTESLLALAATLVNSKVWYFWWD